MTKKMSKENENEKKNNENNRKMKWRQLKKYVIQ